MLVPSVLTKSRFLAGLQCPKRLWQQVHAPLEKYAKPGAQQESGTEIGILAQRMFPGGVPAASDQAGLDASICSTQALIEHAETPAIFEASLIAGRLFARVDILGRGQNAWRIIEVKSSTQVKDVHLDDAAFQLHVARLAGLTVDRVEIAYVNRDYVRRPDGLDVSKLFLREDITAAAEKRLPDIARSIAAQLRILDAPDSPKVEPWSHCHDPYPCEFWERCTAEKPEEWIFNMPRLGEDRASELRSLAIETIGDIPDAIKLTEAQLRVRNAHRDRRAWRSDRIHGALRTFGPPAAYMDFETMSPAIPIYAGTRPYERIPFQWSVHLLNGQGGLQHQGFLANGQDDPREEFARSLLDYLGRSSVPIVVYSPFEKSTLSALATKLPHYATGIARLIARLQDLLAVVRGHIYDPGFNGSYSIKAVGPVLSSVRYDDLEHVADGGAASTAFERIVAGDAPQEEAVLRAALEEYCRRDTLAMVEVHRRLLSRK